VAGRGDAVQADAFLSDAFLSRAEKGLVDADLGGGVLKQRIARPGRGKSRGYRTIIFFRRRGREAVQGGGAPRVRLARKQIEELVKNGDFVEVKGEEEISK